MEERALAAAGFAIREARSAADADDIARLAREIWTEHYTPIIGPEQVEYMLDTFQSADVIARQMAAGGVAYFLITGGTPAGYLAVDVRGELLFLSKIYLRRALRGRRVGAAAIEFVVGLARERRCRAIELTVNRNNAEAIAVYERLGFRRAGERVTDIGRGFVMDDYVYRLELGPDGPGSR